MSGGRERRGRGSKHGQGNASGSAPQPPRGTPGRRLLTARLGPLVQRQAAPAQTPAAVAPRPPAIDGPLAPGEQRWSGDVEVAQISAGRALIQRGDASIVIESGGQRDGYAFHVEAAPADADQRVVRIAATAGVTIDEQHASDDGLGLVAHVRRVAEPALAGTVASAPAHTGMAEILELADERGASLSLDMSVLRIRAEDEHARFAYFIDPHWSGPRGCERLVHIVATPGVRAETLDTVTFARIEGEEDAGCLGGGRVLVPNLLRVQDAAQVPPQGTPIDPRQYLTARRIGGTSHRSARSNLLEVTGRSGVTIRESVTGVALRIAPLDPAVGARFAHQIVTPSEKPEIMGTTEIRVLTGPDVDITVIEPGARPSMGPGPDSFGASNVELVLYQVADPELVPPQGTPLDPAWMAAVGRPRRERLTYAPRTARDELALAVADTATSLIPVVGDAADLGELGKALASGTDRHGRAVTGFDLAVMGIASLLPVVGAGALRAAGRTTRGAARTLDELAARLGKTPDELDALLARIHLLTAQDRAAIARVDRALRADVHPDPDDLRHVRESLGQLGFHTDLSPKAGNIFLFPDVAPPHLGREALGESREVDAVRDVGRRGAGAAAAPRHHVLPQEHRTWFEERGFAGDMDIDHFAIELDTATHQAIHGGGNWKLGRTWPGEWNRRLMRRLREAEADLGRRLRPDEILDEARSLMKQYGLGSKPLVPYKGAHHE